MEVIKPASNLTTNRKVFSLITERQVLGTRILEIGAGRGYMAQELGQHINGLGGVPGEVLTACDLLPDQFKYGEVPCDYFDFVNALPYEDNSYDTVFAIELIEHLESPVEFIKEAYRVLRSGGRFIFSTPNVLNINSRLSYLACGFFILFGPVSPDKADSGNPTGHIIR